VKPKSALFLSFSLFFLFFLSFFFFPFGTRIIDAYWGLVSLGTMHLWDSGKLAKRNHVFGILALASIMGKILRMGIMRNGTAYL
jgi:4-hydroxybenzoate polyprenyltransferase